MYEAAAIGLGSLISIMLSMNSGLERSLGQVRSLLILHMVGMLFVSAILAVRRERPILKSGLPWFYYGAGAMGVLGVIIVSASNVVIPKIPVVYITALFFVGQIFAGLILDFIRFGRSDWAKLAGAALVLSGVLVNVLQDVKKA